MIDKIDIDGDLLAWVCESCKAELTVALGALQVGNAMDADIIGLTKCSCGAQEFVFRRWDDVLDLPHRRAINALVEHLIEAGQSHPDALAKHEAETTVPPMMVDLSAPLTDLTGRQAFALRKAEAEAAAAVWEAGQPARDAAAAAELAAAEAAEEEQLFQIAEARRLSLASAAVNKRLGLPPGSEPPAEELALELTKSADEIVADAEPATAEQLALPFAAEAP